MMAAHHQPGGPPLRKGKWTDEENAYVHMLVVSAARPPGASSAADSAWLHTAFLPLQERLAAAPRCRRRRGSSGRSSLRAGQCIRRVRRLASSARDSPCPCASRAAARPIPVFNDRRSRSLSLSSRAQQQFRGGLLYGLDEGLTLRAYLSQQLFCDSMRITKKYRNGQSMGKVGGRRRHRCRLPPFLDRPDPAVRATH